MEGIKLKNLKRGEFFTRKPIEMPKESQVFTRQEYDRADKRYFCERFSDSGNGIMLKGETIVYVGFTF